MFNNIYQKVCWLLVNGDVYIGKGYTCTYTVDSGYKNVVYLHTPWVDLNYTLAFNQVCWKCDSMVIMQ